MAIVNATMQDHIYELRAEITRLRAALRGQPCPGNCAVTVGECVDRGDCGCDNGPALGSVTAGNRTGGDDGNHGERV